MCRNLRIAPSVGSRGDSYDNALAESVIGLFKSEVIHRNGPWRSLEAVEFATFEWVDWFNISVSAVQRDVGRSETFRPLKAVAEQVGAGVIVAKLIELMRCGVWRL